MACNAKLLYVSVLAVGLAQEKPQYTFGTTVVSTSGLQGRICHLKENTEKLPRLDRMKHVGTIYTNTLNVWPQRFDEGFPGITDRFEWFGIDYTGRFWIEEPGQVFTRYACPISRDRASPWHSYWQSGLLEHPGGFSTQTSSCRPRTPATGLMARSAKCGVR